MSRYSSDINDEDSWLFNEKADAAFKQISLVASLHFVPDDKNNKGVAWILFDAVTYDDARCSLIFFHWRSRFSYAI